MKVVIVGGVAGGMSAATRLRRLDESAEIVVLERGAHVSFANCGLPYYAGGVIEVRDALLLQTPESLRARFRLDVRVGTEVLSIDRARRTLSVRRPDGVVDEESYDVLVLSPGARPFVPPTPGIERALTLRDVEDVDRVVAALDAGGRSAVVVGGGFIGVEMAEQLHRRGLAVTVVELADQLLAPLDPEMAAPVAGELRRHGVDVRLSAQVARVLGDEVELADGERLPADLVVLAIGVRPETGLAQGAGLELGPRGGIAVDDRQRTNDPAIFAVGDATEKRDSVTGEAMLVPLAHVANRAGRRVADVIAGRASQVTPSQGTAIVRAFDLTVAATGASEKRLRAAGVACTSIHTHPASHAGYYPGAEPMMLKLVLDPQDGRILGAQAVGGEGVDKRIDVIATAMAGGLRAPQLADLELAYAPPYGSAKDPVNMLGYVAETVLASPEESVGVGELHGDETLLDVRSVAEHKAGAIPGSLIIPVDELRDRLAELPEGPVVVYCQVGVRGHTAARLLRNVGVDARNLDGGYSTWRMFRDAGLTEQVASAQLANA